MAFPLAECYKSRYFSIFSGFFVAVIDMKKTCPQCTQIFECSTCATERCWCSDYPAIFSCNDGKCDMPDSPTASASQGCLCPACLTIATRQHIENHVDTVQIHVTAPALATQPQAKTFIEGLDYSIDNGNYVFSRWFLLKQGKCCGNKCRNCPYGYVNVPNL
jgi:hypothetical protein